MKEPKRMESSTSKTGTGIAGFTGYFTKTDNQISDHFAQVENVAIKEVNERTQRKQHKLW